jgi:hypothetical protein
LPQPLASASIKAWAGGIQRRCDRDLDHSPGGVAVARHTDHPVQPDSSDPDVSHGDAILDAALCAVCGAPVKPGSGLVATHGPRMLKVGCVTCQLRFELRSDWYGDWGPTGDDCPACRTGARAESPLSEWACY